jgi:hypothetical protein
MAAVAGSVILGVWFAQYWPARSWTVLSRDQVLARASDVAKQFGLTTGKLNTYVKASVSQSLAYYAQQHPNDANARTISPLSERVKFDLPDGSAEVGLDSTGRPIFWNVPDDFKSATPAVSESDAAQKAFALMSGADAALFSAASRSMADDPADEEYVWKKRLPDHADLRDQIKATVRNTVLTRAERALTPTTEEDPDEETGDNHEYWSVLDAVFYTVCTVADVGLFGIYVLWAVRRAVNHRFSLTATGVLFVLLVVRSYVTSGPTSSLFFATVFLLCLTTVGRGISPAAMPKWMPLEQLCGLAPLSRAAGRSLGAGVLCSPMLVAIPFLIAGCGLIPHSVVVAQNVEVLYSRISLLDSLDLSHALYALAFFGFGVPVLTRTFRYRWLRWSIALPLGTVFFANATRVVTGPVAAPLTAGFMTLALFGFLYKYFDLLAVVALQLTAGLLLSAITLANKGGTVWPIALALAAVLAAAWWLAKRGQEVAHGDPRATNPALVGLRGEREKLQAEFSVAKRAQEEMLPRTPPTIPGYSIAASCTPSLDVGGDLYDFLQLPDGRIGLGVADVSGKGVPAALYMTLTKGLLASVCQDTAELASVVEQVNKHLHGVTRKKVFVTMALGFLDAEKRTLQCVRAGHNPMVWRKAAKDETTLVAPAGLGLGITAGRVFGTQLKVIDLELAEGDAVVFYSDGITEAMNKGLEQFGEQRLMDAVAQTDRLDAAGTRDAILKAVREFLDGVHPQDDMTLVVLRVGDERMRVSG